MGSAVVAHGTADLSIGSSQIRDQTVSAALSGGFFTTGPPGNSCTLIFLKFIIAFRNPALRQYLLPSTPAYSGWPPLLKDPPLTSAFLIILVTRVSSGSSWIT